MVHMEATISSTMEDLEGLEISSLNSDDEEDDAFAVEDYYEDEADEDIELGFLEEHPPSLSLLRHSFPSKAGGTPAWLDPVNLPSGKHCFCDTCGKPLRFLLQVYAPIREKESAYHRTLFVFMCTKMSCLLRDQHEQQKREPEEQPCRSVKVFRCQLPAVNPFYSTENDGNEKLSGPGAVLCYRCGTWKGDKRCSGCKKAHYCSERHQRMHWKSYHRYQCRQVGSTNGRTIAPKVPTKKLWREFEIVYDDESSEDEAALGEKMSDDTENAVARVSVNEKNDSMKSFINKSKEDLDNSTFQKYQEIIAEPPRQVLRCGRSPTAKPIWPYFSGHLPKADVPSCKYCGGRMMFEFQILSTLLYFFEVENEVNSLDWATVVVYTCESSCDASLAYKQEFVWVQLHPSNNLDTLPTSANMN